MLEKGARARVNNMSSESSKKRGNGYHPTVWACHQLGVVKKGGNRYHVIIIRRVGNG